MLRFYAPVCELEAMYKFSSDIFSLAEHSDWALQSFTLGQAICAIFFSSSQWMRSAPVFDIRKL